MEIVTSFRSARAATTLLWLTVLACSWFVLIQEVSVQWSIYEQYHYAWAVPFLCTYLMLRQFGENRHDHGISISRQFVSASRISCGPLPGRTLAVWSADAFPPSPDRTVSRCFSAAIPLIVSMLYAPTRWLHEANPTWRLTTLLWSVEIITLTLWTLYEVWGWHELQRYWFPVLFFACAIPWPSSLENSVVRSLTQFATSTSVNALDFMGVPALQHGNVVETAAGAVGINEACSGIRSLQATLMLSVFFGEFYCLTLGRRASCILAGCAISFVANLSRTTFLACMVAGQGAPALARWHDSAGISVLVVSFLGLWFLSSRLAPSLKPPRDAKPRAVPFDLAGIKPTSTTLLLILAAWLALIETGTRLWYWTHEREAKVSRSWSIQSHPAFSGFYQKPISPEVSDQFQADLAITAQWADSEGVSGQLHYFRWLPARTAKKRALIELARAHEPEVCLPGLGMELKSDFGLVKVRLAGMEIVLQHYVFSAEGKSIQVFFGIFDDRSGPEHPIPSRKDIFTRFAAAKGGNRSSGQRFLEIAFLGLENREEAVSAIRAVAPRLIQVDQPAAQSVPVHHADS